MGGRRKKSIPKVVPKVEKMDEYTRIVEEQLLEGNIGEEIVISMEEESEVQQRRMKEELYLPEVEIKVESLDSDQSLSGSSHLVADSWSLRAENDLTASQNLLSGEPPIERPRSKGPPSIIQEGMGIRTRSRNRVQQNNGKLGNTKPVESPKITSRRPTTAKVKKKLPKLSGPKKAHACNKCELSFTHKIELLHHGKAHAGDDRLACDQCGYRATRIDYLIRHLRYHTGERPFLCAYCPYGARDRTALRAHELIHVGTKPFACALCDYRANKKHKLVPHLRRHYGWKPFKCKKCNWRFVEKSELKIHMRVHLKKTTNPDMSGVQHLRSFDELKEHKAKLYKAVQAVLEGKLPVKRAARVHGVPVSTLYYRIYPRRHFPNGRNSLKVLEDESKEKEQRSEPPPLKLTSRVEVPSRLRKSTGILLNGSKNHNQSCKPPPKRTPSVRAPSIRKKSMRILQKRNKKDFDSPIAPPSLKPKPSAKVPSRLYPKKKKPMNLPESGRKKEVPSSKSPPPLKLKPLSEISSILSQQTRDTRLDNVVVPPTTGLDDMIEIKPVMKEEKEIDMPSLSRPTSPSTSCLSNTVSNGWLHVCKTCSFEATSSFEWEEHQNFHLGFLCSLCNFRSLEKDDLKIHVMSVHIM